MLLFHLALSLCLWCNGVATPLFFRLDATRELFLTFHLAKFYCPIEVRFYLVIWAPFFDEP